MTQNSYKNILLFLFVVSAFYVEAQKDTLLPLASNPALFQPAKKNISAQKLMAIGDTIELPFYDDFSYSGTYPDDTKWMNSNSVFVNRTLGKNPPTIGVATFDGLKSNGYPYKPMVISGVGNADTLTSKYIRLDSLAFPPVAITPADSVYLSFSYEPKGFSAYPPLSLHTLILDFYNPTTQSWATIMTLSRTGNTYKDSTFTRVMIPIKDPAYFKKQFRFRFRNKNSGTGAVYQWHIDNVYLAKDRGIGDTSMVDLAFVYPGQSLLEKYTAIPYNQYTGANQMAAHSYLKIRNNDKYATNFTGFMNVDDNLGTSVLFDTTGTDNAQPFATNGYIANPDIVDFLNSTASPDINNFVFNNGNPLTDSITYTIKHFLRTSAGDKNKTNDTLVYQQKFLNYFSYDDGSAEAGWGLAGTIGAEAALQFQLTKPDTMRAIDIFFAPVPVVSSNLSVTQIESLTFGLRVWNDAGGAPGSYLYDDNNSMTRNPIHRDWGNNVFVRYYLNYPLPMNAGVFYAGFKQDLDAILSFGYDQNSNMQSKLFQKTTSVWQHPFWPGTLMLRPVFGDSARVAGFKNESSQEIKTIIFPNPANNHIRVAINTEVNNTITVEIMDALGKSVMNKNTNTNESISVSELEQGFYFVRVYINNKLTSTQKLIIAR